MKILVTGSSKGIGKAIIDYFLAQNNHYVIGISRHNNITHENFIDFKCDLANIKQVQNISRDLVSKHNDVDVFILNAGFGVFTELEQFSDQQILDLFNVNVINQIILFKKLLPQFRKRDKANLIIIGSEAGKKGAKKSSIYSACKFALNGFAQSMRAELSSDAVSVTIINPGMVNSNFHDNCNFRAGDDFYNKIEVKNIVSIIDYIISCDNNMVFDEINVSQMKKVINFLNKNAA
ncbi:MAG: SDR family NAD(P)-dependent oxidoreductase [Rickettsiales bacterium]|nr:SDR family NAD(P)-dependent oxidoreductase [Rickettsiales bacterium]